MMTSRLEEQFGKVFGSKFAISFINGTATMYGAFEAHGIGPGDEVIVPPLTMSATTFAVLQCNATPVFADIDPDLFRSRRARSPRGTRRAARQSSPLRFMAFRRTWIRSWRSPLSIAYSCWRTVPNVSSAATRAVWSARSAMPRASASEYEAHHQWRGWHGHHR